MDLSRYALGGRPPECAARPGSEAELVETLRAAERDRLPVVPFGGGVGLAGLGPPERYGLALDLTGLDRVIEYEPEDLTLTAQCGATLAALGGTLAAQAQDLPIEGARAATATLGGVLAANASGPRRLRFGSPRDRILGVRFALADGTVARSGGKVVKNVAGYGLHRLLCGSRGGLAILLEASLKLTPAPEARAALLYATEPGALADAERWRAFPRLEPAWLTVAGPAALGALARGDAPWAAASRAAVAARRHLVIAGLEDDAPRVRQQIEQVRKALGTADLELAGAEAVALSQAVADLEAAPGPRLFAAGSANTPSAVAALLELPETEGAVLHAPAGRLHLAVTPERAATVARELGRRGFVRIESAGVHVEPVAPQQLALAKLRGRIRDALDPQRALALGGRWELGVC